MGLRLPSYEALERSFNNGSPSGYGLESLTGSPYHPSSLEDFPLLLASCPDGYVEDFGEAEAVLGRLGLGRNEVPLHPANPRRDRVSWMVRSSGLPVWPTAAGRTVSPRVRTDLHLKLDFDGRLGRTNRAVTGTKALHCLAVWGRLQLQLPPSGIHLYPEIGARLALDSSGSWGLILRSFSEWPDLSSEIVRVPLFSLHTERLSRLLCSELTISAREEIAVAIIRLTCRAYLWCWLECGLHMELNAQNIVIAFDDTMSLFGIAIRDFQDIEFDLDSPAQVKGVNLVHAWAPYKVIGRSIDHEHWQRRHSIAFDHKLFSYIIFPTVRGLLPERHAQERALARARGIAQQLLTGTPDDFFPAGKLGFRYHGGLLTESRPVIRDVPLWLRDPA